MSYSTRILSSEVATRGLQRLTLGLVLAFWALFVLMGCASTERAKAHAEQNAAYSTAHASDSSISGDARAVGAVNRISWQVQAFLLGGSKPDPDVIEALPLEFRQEIGLAPSE